MFENVKKMKIEIKNEKYNQNQRNALKVDLLNQIVKMISSNVDENEVRIAQVSDGYAIEIANEEVGCVCFTFDIKMKNPTYDFDIERDLFSQIKNEKLEKQEQKRIAKIQKIENDKQKRIESQKAKLAKLEA